MDLKHIGLSHTITRVFVPSCAWDGGSMRGSMQGSMSLHFHGSERAPAPRRRRQAGTITTELQDEQRDVILTDRDHFGTTITCSPDLET